MRGWVALLGMSAMLVGGCPDDPQTGLDVAVDAGEDGTPDADGGTDTADAEEDIGPAPSGVAVRFDLSGGWGEAATFWDHPYPSDLRLDGAGHPDLAGLSQLATDVDLIAGLWETAQQRRGFPVMPVAWFRFDGEVAPGDVEDVVPAAPESPVLLVDVDPESGERGRLVPTIAGVLPQDPHVPPGILAVAPRPGFVLRGDTTYAIVVRRGWGDAGGAELGVPEALWQLAHGQTPAGALGVDAAALMAPLWETLDILGVARTSVAAATVFTTGDAVADLAEVSDGIVAREDATFGPLAVDPDDGAAHERFCELHGTVTYPQFQEGTPPFDADGLFVDGPGGLPVVQREATVPLVVTLPKAPMPEGGYPVVFYFHGSGGLSSQAVDRPTKGQGPAHVLARHGLGTVASAMPVNPERVPGASAIEYLNFLNLKAFRDTFRQGVIEQRLLIEALGALEIEPSVVAACAGMSLPPGETAYRFAVDPVMVTGQSMGGMYANLVSAVEPRVRAVVPTGAGGFWSYMILVTDLLDAGPLLELLLEVPEGSLTHLHPGLHLMQTAWEVSEPVAFMPRLSKDPLPGHQPRDIYEPVGLGDSYFPSVLYDAVALAYGHPQAGSMVWASMQQALELVGLDGLLEYPVHTNLQAHGGGASYTGAIVQYAGDGTFDPHSIYVHLDAVKYQYGCFFESFLATGHGTIPAPADFATPCPTL